MADPSTGSGATAAPPGGRTDPTAHRAELRSALEIVALCGLVITQPLLDVTGKSPDFFLFHGAGPADIVLLMAVYTLLPPALLWGVGALVGLAGRAVRRMAHLVTLGVLCAALAVQVGKHLFPVRGLPLVVVALTVGVASGYAYRRWSAPGQLLRVAAVGPLVFILLFAFVSPASAVLLPARWAGSAQAARADRAVHPKRLHPPVVMLVLDEFPLVSLLGPDGMIDERRFPNFARLAGQSTWYRNATGVSGWTPYALPAMLTGRYPARELAPHYAQYPDNLFTLLGEAYDVRAQESISQLCPPSRCLGHDVALRGGLPVLLRESALLLEQIVSPSAAGWRDPESSYREITRSEAGLDDSDPVPTDPTFRWSTLDENQPARFSEFLAGLRPVDRPTLHFLHLLLPHSPWNYLPSGVRYESPPGMVNDGDGWVELAHERHMYQVEYTDQLIGETLHRLESSGLYDDALVVLTADHGVSFTPGAQGRGLDALRWAPGELLWVPMFIKEPGQRTGLIDDRNWEHVDLLPTIADLAGLRVPWRTDGASVLPTIRTDGNKRYYDQPGRPLTVPGPATFAALLSGAAQPALPAPPLPELVGRPTTDLSISGTGGSATVANLADFRTVDPASGRLPALVYGTVPDAVPAGTRLAVAVNGRVGAVTRVVDPDLADRRFAALLPDGSLFSPGANRLELFQVAEDGVTMRRLRI